MAKYLVCGAGGFIGGHIVKKLIYENHEVTCVDVKPFDLWFQLNDSSINYSLDLKILENCEKVVQGQDYVINMACNMGGIGFIEWNKAKCMISVLINTHMLMACEKFKVKKYFFSSTACVYNKDLQQTSFVNGLKEEDAYPANPEDGYGWEKLFSERMCRHFHEDFKLDTKVARYHNIYGPIGTFDGGREKSPAALCRKVAQAKISGTKDIEVWGDGTQTRSYLFIEDCVEATLKFIDSEDHGPINIGSEEQVSINQMLEIIEKIANYKVNKIYNTNMPIGVKGRSSNNDKIREVLNWDSNIKLEQGLSITYSWIEKMIIDKKNISSVYTIS